MQNNGTGTKTAKKERTPERQAEIDKGMAEKHAEQTKIETALRAEINEQADQAIEMYKFKNPRTLVPVETIKQEIINRIANGQTLTSVCKLKHIPDPRTVLEWVAKDPIFAKQYTHARLNQADILFSQCLDIADDASRDMLENPDKSKVINHAAIARDRLKIETRFRMAGKLNGKYADKSALVAEGASVTVNNLSINPRDMSPDSRDKLRKLLLEAKAGTNSEQ